MTIVRNILAIAAGRLVALILRRVLGRGASAGPGLVADRIAPALLAEALSTAPSGLVVVTGSSGKSTTTKMLAAILRAHGFSVFTNSSTANLRQGVMSAIVDAASWTGRLPHDIAVIELDEAAAAALSTELRPRLLVATNVSDDQLDRFLSPERVLGFIAKMAGRSDRLVLGYDDSRLRELGDGRTTWFGQQSPDGSVAVTADGDSAVLSVHGQSLAVPLPARGRHYALDAAAAVEASHVILGRFFSPERTSRAFDGLEPVFGRGERRRVDDEDVEFVLVQNTDSLRRNLEVLHDSPARLMVAVGDDVRDPSWLWAVDTSELERVDVVAGTRAFEMATRLAYDGVQVDTVLPDVGEAFGELLRIPAHGTGPTTVVYSADAMRKLRRATGLDRIVA